MPAHIIEIPNLLKPNDGRVVHAVEPGLTIEQWFAEPCSELSCDGAATHYRDF